jgi:hypothetical protein
MGISSSKDNGNRGKMMAIREPAPPSPTLTRLRELWKNAGTFQIALEEIARRSPLATLNAEQVRVFNEYLAEARTLLPDSVILKDDVVGADLDTPVSEAEHALRVDIVPTLHNALPVE